MFVELIFESNSSAEMKGLILELQPFETVWNFKAAIQRMTEVSAEHLDLWNSSGKKIKNSELMSELLSAKSSLRLTHHGQPAAAVSLYSCIEPGTPFAHRAMRFSLERTESSSETVSESSVSYSMSYQSSTTRRGVHNKSIKSATLTHITSRRAKAGMPFKMPKGKGFEAFNLLTRRKSQPKIEIKDDEEDEEEKEVEPDEESEESEECASSQCPDRRLVCCNTVKCGKPDTRPPYATTLPEDRRYAMMITNDDPAASNVNIRAIMDHLFSLFIGCCVADLSFYDCVPMARYDCVLMIVAKDEYTADWLANAITGVCPPHSCLPFIQFFGLVRAHFVLPLVVPEKMLCSIFELFEHQNCGLVTYRWAVIGRYLLDPCATDNPSKAVSSLNENQEIDLFIDEASRDFILEQCSKIKYCFWHLLFTFP
ncbi:uncharacterized protein Dana_GF17939, isoform B [Drosophila ananassae]|uniref:Uncharacterized protein, isoform A n=1 Tax=Drosophila ananassae TaxID=7217 RepID=B3M2M9_DROAN|nr:uncharacterized protein LOC6500720 [Drosophila ananassae]EDV42350.1 uncharacterized protein Dana_GF17939, isoform A [Drosophila ananassae]KPU79678.1 uncharacterized protein Dana_GF17939, isoform B [Drosophila ananassae]